MSPPTMKPPTMKPEHDGHQITSLRRAAEAFFSHRGPRVIAMTAATGWARRLTMGRPRLAEVPLAAAVLAWWPFQEWLAHKHVLHLEPFELFGRTIDPDFAQVHRAHHRQPRDIRMTLLPLGVLATAIPVATMAFQTLVRDRRLAATAMATYSTAALVYEWTHFLVHTGYKPRSAFYARVRRNHRNHHYKNEAYWYGFTVPHVDEWLGTEPDPKSVPTSPTARDLHGLDRDRDEPVAA